MSEKLLVYLNKFLKFPNFEVC